MGLSLVETCDLRSKDREKSRGGEVPQLEAVMGGSRASMMGGTSYRSRIYVAWKH